ncbi:hypothetical protein D7B24_008435 [Verticillium nonalfalfae]|uniref:alpha-galactosidase n=1 Tax=Verticillium nonalfalfae TaxID=1051616 RepID=A0A3M9Y5M2_9PEZI|nr:uncharacterized protein D7B24_008435 [Verticillium nonalfalfae]RNJ55571.1 hypothetical protein D7B24_008435 [Verticillium nonalfalfae]
MDLCSAFSFAPSSPAASAAALATFNACVARHRQHPVDEAPWQPAAGTTWQILLDAPLAIDLQAPAVTPDVEVYDVDLFENPASTFAALRALGKRVVCYFSAGSYEDGRPDSGDFDTGAGGDLGRELEGWPGEYWLDTNSETVRGVMRRRIELAREKGCDGVDPDNVDGFTNRNGLGLTAADSIDYITFLAFEARRHGLAMGLKNGGSILKNVLPVIDFSVNEECAAYGECDLYKAVTDAGKPVFHIEYPDMTKNGVQDKDARRRACKAKGAGRFSTVMKGLDLNGWVQYCDGNEYKTEEDKVKT